MLQPHVALTALTCNQDVPEGSKQKAARASCPERPFHQRACNGQDVAEDACAQFSMPQKGQDAHGSKAEADEEASVQVDSREGVGIDSLCSERRQSPSS